MIDDMLPYLYPYPQDARERRSSGSIYRKEKQSGKDETEWIHTPITRNNQDHIWRGPAELLKGRGEYGIDAVFNWV